MTTPTIIIPGIKGTTLVNTNTLDFDTIWSGIQSKFESSTIYKKEILTIKRLNSHGLKKELKMQKERK